MFVGAYTFVECAKCILEKLYSVSCVVPLGIMRRHMTAATQSSHKQGCSGLQASQLINGFIFSFFVYFSVNLHLSIAKFES